MLVIRQSQMQVLSRTMSDRFADMAERHAWSQFAMDCEALGPAAVRARVDTMMHKAPGYGLRSQADHLAYLDCMFVLGPEFDVAEPPAWPGEILRSKRIPGERKMELIAKRHRADLLEQQT